MTMLLLTVILALSVLVTVCIFLDAYNVHKASNEHCAPVKNKLSLNKKMHSNVE